MASGRESASFAGVEHCLRTQFSLHERRAALLMVDLARLDMTLAAVVQHLQVLEKSGLVRIADHRLQWGWRLDWFRELLAKPEAN